MQKFKALNDRHASQTYVKHYDSNNTQILKKHIYQWFAAKNLGFPAHCKITKRAINVTLLNVFNGLPII